MLPTQRCEGGLAGLCVDTCVPSFAYAGAIFGVAGALAVFFYRHRDVFGATSDAVLKQMGQALAINTLIGFTTPQVDQWWAPIRRLFLCSGLCALNPYHAIALK